MGYPGKVKFRIISYHFPKCDHKGELSAVFSTIYYLNKNYWQGQVVTIYMYITWSHI